MTQFKNLQNLDLECLRLQSDCLQLAGEAPEHMRPHFVRMARTWFAMTSSGAAKNSSEFCEGTS